MESKTFFFVAQLMYQLGAGFQVVDRWMFLCGRFFSLLKILLNSVCCHRGLDIYIND